MRPSVIITLPYSHKDIHQAYRLLKWIGWLSSLHADAMRKETVLLVPSKHASERALHRSMCKIAESTFHRVQVCIPSGEHERGWPGACNFMLRCALEHGESDDKLLLEPDAIPLTPEWFDEIKAEWEAARMAGKEFMGAYVPYGDPAHMTGIGVYGRNWREKAPKLAVVQNERGWDTFAADQIVPNAHFTALIHHVWWRYAKSTYDQLSLDRISNSAVIFHQDKEGRLFRMLDMEYWGGRADKAVGYSEPIQDEIFPMHYFYTHNLSTRIVAQGLEFQFNPVDSLAGTWRGVYATEKEAEIIALRALIATGASTVVELTKEEFEERTKKKAPIFLRSNVSNPQPPQEARVNQSPAKLVDGAEPPTPPESITQPVVEDIEDVLAIAKVKPPETAPKKTQKPPKKGK